MSKRKVNHQEPEKPSKIDIHNIIDQKYVLAEILKRMKERSEAAERNIVATMGRIDKLELTTKEIIKKFKHHLNDCEQGCQSHGKRINLEAIASKFMKNLESRICNLEENVANANKKICMSEEEKKSLMDRIRSLQKEAELTKKACMEIIYHEIKKTKAQTAQGSKSLNDCLKDMRESNFYESFPERKPKRLRRGVPS